MARSLADVVGQSLMLSFEGPRATPAVLDALSRTRAGGVILFSHNIATPADLHELCGALQAHAAALDLPPLLIAIDQEGGIVSRLAPPFTTVPGQMAQAATADTATAYECARITARQLRAAGVNTNFAPVLDVNCNPANPVIGIRSFGADAGVVTRFGLAALRGYREAGVIATVKHFPGHGDTDVDSHLGLPVVRHTRERIEQIELAPFVAAIRAGVPALMTAHIVFSAFDDLPATLSRRVLTGLLRRELGFTGLVFSDALDMRAIADRYGTLEATIMAKAAGVDMLLPLGALEQQVVVAHGLRDALQNGRLPLAVFEATDARLAALRAGYQLTHALPELRGPDESLDASALAIARKSVTLLHDRGVLPLASGARLTLIDCMVPRFSQVEEAISRAELLRALVQQTFPRATSLALSPELTDQELAQAQALASAGEVTLLVTRGANANERQSRLAAALAALDAPLIHAAVRSPSDVTAVPGAATTLLTYGDPPVSLRALVDALSGGACAGESPAARAA